MHQAVFFSLTAWWKGRLILCTRTASINQCHLPFPFLYISFFLKSLWPFLNFFFLSPHPAAGLTTFIFWWECRALGTCPRWRVLKHDEKSECAGRKEEVEGTLWRRAREGAKRIALTSADGTMQTPAVQRAPHCHREQRRPPQGPAAPVGPLTASPRVPRPELTPEARARGAAGAPPACLRRGRAAETADRRTGTVWRRPDGSPVPFLTSRAGSFLAPDAPRSLGPAAHTSHSCTVLAHQRPRLCLPQRRGARPTRFEPGHGACTTAAAQPAPTGAAAQPRQSPTALGPTPLRQARGKAPAGGLLCLTGWQIRQPGEKQTEKGHNQAEIQSGYAAAVRYGRRFLDEGLRCVQKLGPRLHPGPHLRRDPRTAPGMAAAMARKGHTKSLGVLQRGFPLGLLSCHGTLRSTALPSSAFPLAGRWKRKHWATGTFTEGLVMLSSSWKDTES